jgi:pyruvate dehydrogenase E2 component (dihydrolipoamide acetyltransferase)
MATRIIMPQGGQDITEGVVVRWLKKEGEAVRRGQVICEVETEKAVFEVESPLDGVLLKIVAREGTRVPIFATIGVAGAPGEEAEAARLLEAEARREPPADPASAPRTAETGAPEAQRRAASGRAQRLASEKGVDLAALTGSGPRGRITEKDVLLHVEKRRLAVAGLKGHAVPLAGLRRAVGRRMLRSKQTVPHFYVTVSADMSAALAVKQRLNAAASPAVTLTDLILKAAACALRAHPRINCRLQEERIVYFDDVNIGIAVTLEEGVAVPVLAGADRMSLIEIAARSRELRRLAREGRIPPTDLAGFTVSNLGMFHIDNFIAIINPPESAILAVGSVQKRPVAAADGGLSVREMMTMTLSVDHRVVDGAPAAVFLNTVKDGLEQPERLVDAMG